MKRIGKRIVKSALVIGVLVVTGICVFNSLFFGLILMIVNAAK